LDTGDPFTKKNYAVSSKQNQLREYFLYPGTIFGDNKPTRVKTILGSCVSVCLFDTVLKQGGINHYMLPSADSHRLPSPNYGNVAIRQLIEVMIALGSEKANIVAKVFGGADQHSAGGEGYKVGARNVELAEDILNREKIPIVAQNTGGPVGRKLFFYTHQNKVLLKFL
jgi:chemotaxis protein CheD